MDIFSYISSEEAREKLKNSQKRHICTTARGMIRYGNPFRSVSSCWSAFRTLPGVTIQVLLRGDGRSYPRPGHKVRYRMARQENEEGTENIGDLKKFYVGFEKALMTMSPGEKAKITVERKLLRYANSAASHAENGETSRTLVFTLLSIE